MALYCIGIYLFVVALLSAFVWASLVLAKREDTDSECDQIEEIYVHNI